MKRLKRIVGPLSLVVTLLALSFAAYRLWTMGGSIWDALSSERALAAMLGGGVAYAFIALLLVVAWRLLLVSFGETPSLSSCIAIYGRTQIAKYLPGNFLHLPGRHMMGAALGIGHRALVASAVYEIVGLIAASVAVSLALLTGEQLAPGGATPVQLVVLLALLLGAPVILQLLATWTGLAPRLGLPDRSARETARLWLPAVALYVAFFLLTGLLLWAVGFSVLAPVDMKTMVAAYAIAWLAGFVVPGAPAGLGVREATMIVLLSGVCPEAVAVSIAVAGRLVVTLGDVVLFGLSFLFQIGRAGPAHDADEAAPPSEQGSR